jgi:hypothetical protein
MVRVGLFGAFEGEDAIVAAVLRAELAARLPGLELRVYTPSGSDTSIGMTEEVDWVDQPLGPFGPIRLEELAATLDTVVVAGRVDCDAASDAPERFLVQGLGPFEPDVPVVWFGVSLAGDVPGAREALERRAAMWVTGHGAAERLAELGVQAQTVPNPAIAFARIASAEQLRPLAERLRAASAVPDGDFAGVDIGVVDDVPNGATLPQVGASTTPLDRAAAIMASSVYVGASATGQALATAYGRPAVWTGATDDPAASKLDGDLASLDAALDQLAKLLETAEPAEGRAARTLRVRLREEERAAAEREQALTAYNAALSNEIVSVGPRYTALWRKIHTGDRHYNWHRLRADRAEADVEKLWNLHERRASMRLKRAIRSTKLGDAAARALGAGPLVPPPAKSGSEGPDAPTA